MSGSEPLRPGSTWGWSRRTLFRITHFHGGRLGQRIRPLDALVDEIDKRSASGESEADATLAVIEDFENRPEVGFEPTRADVPFVHERLIKKESKAQLGSFFTFLGFLVLLIVIL